MKYILEPFLDYILLPVVFFLLAVILTIGYTFILVFKAFWIFVWHLSLKSLELEYTQGKYDSISPYWKWWECIAEDGRFKSYYHYIWGVEDKIVWKKTGVE